MLTINYYYNKYGYHCHFIYMKSINILISLNKKKKKKKKKKKYNKKKKKKKK